MIRRARIRGWLVNRPRWRPGTVSHDVRPRTALAEPPLIVEIDVLLPRRVFRKTALQIPSDDVPSIKSLEPRQVRSVEVRCGQLRILRHISLMMCSHATN